LLQQTKWEGGGHKNTNKIPIKFTKIAIKLTKMAIKMSNAHEMYQNIPKLAFAV
jgi:hypothetical protein